MNSIFSSLLQADFIVQWRNRRASIMSLLAPLIILISWRGVVDQFGGPFALASCITFGMIAVGLMGYSNSTARDREKGVFQRLRTTPATTAMIMGSRIIVQLTQIAVMTIIIFLAGYFLDKIILSPLQYLLALLIGLVGGCLYLGVGQALVGLIASAETLSSATRLIYFAFIIVGAFGELGIMGKIVAQIVQWSPYGTVKAILYGAMQPSVWNAHAWWALLLTLVYTAIFAFIGIKWFKWSSQ